MQPHELTLARAASELTAADLGYLQQHGMLAERPGASGEEATGEAITQERSRKGGDRSASAGGAAGKAGRKRKRRSVKHQWPEVGTVLYADYQGVHYEAEVISAPRYKSGRALKLLTVPAAGAVCHSFSGAMLKATDAQRREQDLNRKGAASGWGFWSVKEEPA